MYFLRKLQLLTLLQLCKKCPYLELLWSVFPAFRLNTERYSVSLRIQSKCGNLQIRITPNRDTFHTVYTNIKPYINQREFGSFNFTLSRANKSSV